MGSYSEMASKARRQAEACKTETGRRRALNRAASYDAMAEAEARTAADAAALLARLAR